jgi:hypothetical protein
MAAIVHNTGTNYTLYYNILNYFKGVMEEHPSINAVSKNNLDSIDYDQFPSYPFGNVSITQTIFGLNTTNFSVQIIVADKQKNKNNESEGERNLQEIPFFGVDDMVDIHANTLAIINDITSYTQRSLSGFDVNDDITCTQFSDRFNNGLAGWVSTFTLTTHNDKNRCEFELYN